MYTLIFLVLCVFSYKNTVIKYYLLDDYPELTIVMKDIPSDEVDSKVDYLIHTKDFDFLVPNSAPYVHTQIITVNNDTVYFKEGGLCINSWEY